MDWQASPTEQITVLEPQKKSIVVSKFHNYPFTGGFWDSWLSMTDWPAVKIGSSSSDSGFLSPDIFFYHQSTWIIWPTQWNLQKTKWTFCSKPEDLHSWIKNTAPSIETLLNPTKKLLLSQKMHFKENIFYSLLILPSSYFLCRQLTSNPEISGIFPSDGISHYLSWALNS